MVSLLRIIIVAFLGEMTWKELRECGCCYPNFSIRRCLLITLIATFEKIIMIFPLNICRFSVLFSVPFYGVTEHLIRQQTERFFFLQNDLNFFIEQ